MSANTLELPQDNLEDADYRSPLRDDPKLFVGQTEAERAAQAGRALGVVEPLVDKAAQSGGHRLEVLMYTEAAVAHELKRRRGAQAGEPPRPPSDLGA